MDINKYSNGKIYKLVNDVDAKEYIGHTCLQLCKRLHKHKRDAKIQLERAVYKHLNEIGFDKVKIILVENYPCKSIEELKARERYWIDELKPCLNTNLPLRTDKDFREENKEYYAQYNKEYREKNKDKLAQQAKEYRKNNIQNIKQYQKQYREAHQDELKAKGKQTIKCECGCEIRKGDLTRHKRSEKHQEWIEDKYKCEQSMKNKIKCECGCNVGKYEIHRHKKSKKHQEWLQNQPSTSMS